MTKYTKYLLVSAALVGISASVPVTAATSYQEVWELNSQAVKAGETDVSKVDQAPVFIPSTYQEVWERNSAVVRAGEIAEDGSVVFPVSAAPGTFQDVFDKNMI